MDPMEQMQFRGGKYLSVDFEGSVERKMLQYRLKRGKKVIIKDRSENVDYIKQL